MLLRSSLSDWQCFLEISFVGFRLRKEMIKFVMYDKPFIQNDKFNETFPEIRMLTVLPVAWWHRVLFLVAQFGLRRWVIYFLGGVRTVKGGWARFLGKRSRGNRGRENANPL